jgi:hypothetical protein
MAQDPVQETKVLVTKWHDRISTAKRWRDKLVQEKGWERYIDEYKGKYDVSLGDVVVPPINEVYAYTQTAMASLYARDPYIAVNPKRNASVLGAKILEAAVNYYWRTLDIKEDGNLEIMDAILVGHGINKVGTNVQTAGEGENLVIKNMRMFSSRVSWRDFLFNVGTQRIGKDSLWVAQRIMRPTDDVNMQYGCDLKGNAHPGLDEKTVKDTLYKDDIKFSALWEIWDARARMIYLIADEKTDKFLKEPAPWPEWLTEFPFQILSFNDVPDEAYPMSDIASWEPQLLEKIKIFTQNLQHVKRYNRQVFIKKGTMDESEKDKYELGLDGTVCETNESPEPNVKVFDLGTLPSDLYVMLDRLDGIKRHVSGQLEADAGGTTQTKTRTIGELRMMRAGSQSRNDRKIDRIEVHCKNIARHLLMNICGNMDVDRVVAITGKEPQEIIEAFEGAGIYDPTSRTIKFNADLIKGEYDVAVQPGSTLPLDKEVREQRLTAILETAAKFANATSLPPFLQTIIRELLSEYEIKSLEVAFEEQMANQTVVQANAMEDAEAERAKIKAETAKRDAQATQINVDTGIKTAQAIQQASAPQEELEPVS